jgi:NADPH:quinone reductase-like Zn-dependent oxidoreductase
MKTWELRGVGLDTLVLADRAAPEPGPGEVVVAVRAAGLNFRDLAIARGIYPPGRPLPLVLGSDLAGVVTVCGPGVHRFRPGDRVVATYVVDWAAGEPEAERMVRRLGGPLDGALAEQAVVPEHALVPLPAGVTFGDAATLPVAGVTAWRALFGSARLTPGQTVLLFGTGGVSIFGLQLARAAGARAVVVGGDPAKLERARTLGATAVADRRGGWESAVLEATGGLGADVALDVVGGATTARAAGVLRTGGLLVLVGFLESPQLALDVRALIGRSLRLEAVSTGNRDDLAALVRGVAHGALKPEVDRTFLFTEAPAALAHLASGRHVGKIVVDGVGG